MLAAGTRAKANPMGNEDDMLVARLLAGDAPAFRALVDRFHGRLLRLAASFVADRSVAEEVVQETWVAVVQGLATFERRSSLDTWVIRILCNRARTRGVREKRTVPFSALDDEERVEAGRFKNNGHWGSPPSGFGEEDPERLLLRGEVLAALKGALEELPANQRVVVTLRDIEGLESHEVCNALDITETNQRVILHRGRARLRAILEARFGGQTPS